MDGVDGVLVNFQEIGDQPGSVAYTPSTLVISHHHLPFPKPLVDELLSLNSVGHDELHRAQLASTALVQVYADVVRALTQKSRIADSQVRAIAAHGQTVRHRPGEFNGIGYTIQLNNPALLAELTGIDVVADFRSRDLAAGGQGAPLVPAFHRMVFARTGVDVAVLNIGGISNLTLIRGDDSCIGFDCGPGNALMDLWCREHTGAAYDDAGRWASTGRAIEPLLRKLLEEPYLERSPPKSSGRDLFNRSWLQAAIAEAVPGPVAPEDVQATLLELTSRCCADAIMRYMPGAKELIVCGGGALNQRLMSRLTESLKGLRVTTSVSKGLPVDQVEATAFAWLGWAFCNQMPGNLPGVTGAAGPRILGALYPGGSRHWHTES